VIGAVLLPGTADFPDEPADLVGRRVVLAEELCGDRLRLVELALGAARQTAYLDARWNTRALAAHL